MERKVIQLLKNIAKDTNIEITCNTDILNDIGLDSAQLMQLILKVEESFNIVIDFGNFSYNCLSSVSDFCDYLAQTKSN